VVEAAGVEPASEKAQTQKNYARIPFQSVGPRLRTDKKALALARLISVCGSGQKPSTYPAK
jgi:hypothetical protein